MVQWKGKPRKPSRPVGCKLLVTMTSPVTHTLSTVYPQSKGVTMMLMVLG